MLEKLFIYESVVHMLLDSLSFLFSLSLFNLPTFLLSLLAFLAVLPSRLKSIDSLLIIMMHCSYEVELPDYQT